MSETDRYLVISPFFHSYGYKIGIIVGLLHGCAIYPMAIFDADAALALIESERITMVPGAPAIFLGLLESPNFATTDTSSLRFANTGAANVPVALVERLQRELNFDLVITAFGMTECVVATMCRRGDSDETIATTCGRAIDGMETAIADPETGEHLPPGSEGELLLRGTQVMLGYLDDPAATAEAIDGDGWLHTGDVGVLDDRGYLRITDRLKDMYICGGFNVYPAEVEQALMRLDGVVDVAVVGAPDERLGEVGKAFVVRRDESGPDAESVIAFAKERLANFKVPREIVFVDALPRNLSGKVLKNELRNGTATEPRKNVVTYEVVDQVARITLNRPEYRNAQNSAMTYALDAAFQRATDDDAVKVIVLAGNGKHFCAGHDIGTPGRDVDQTFERKAVIWWDHTDKEGGDQRFARESEVYLGMCRRWREIPKPVIAMVHGACIAGGLMLAWSADFIIASDDAFFSDPVVRMGIPGVEYFAHPWVMNPRAAKEFLYCGDRFTADRALALGMVNQVVPRDELESTVLALAGRIAEMPRFGLALTKKAVNQAEDLQGMRAGMDSVFGLHHFAHAHNAETSEDSLGGLDAKSMAAKNKEQEQG